MEDRISRDEYFMRIAEAAKERSTCPRLKVGAVIVDGTRILSTGYNGAPRGMPHCIEGPEHDGEQGTCKNVVHAELNALLRRSPGIGEILYTTTAPCRECAKAIINEHIPRVVYLHAYHRENVIDYLREGGVTVHEHKR